jgi:flavin-binding protein dodecin
MVRARVNSATVLTDGQAYAVRFWLRRSGAGPRSANMSDHVYKSLDLTGSSSVGIEDAISKAIAKASETVRNIQWFNVVETRGHVVAGKVAHWQVTLKVGFTLE